ncbi:MAG: pentapeptide repeat-containing protein [Haliscomenobacter sp.]|uniref:pentapeptide repeat-containing protein n=1 Tax=Haliscomenobacter sp. TaxID=2717303 RepID=UPI0029B22572|nr:pentapeptide repeat-containing protein [Haliscomenobacter sp.]MDX2069993.1 pentapeptide repeat-containing protein [Haliscomenobacter sp.]
MATENTSKPVSRSTMPQIIFGALVGILLGIAGVLIYQGYLGQITGILLYVSLVFFGVVVLTFILVWGFKTYLTRLIFGSKMADSPDLIAEAQNIASELSDGVIDKVMENATEEQRENAKGLVLRLGNWFVWGRLRNWWWNWILGIFVSLGGLTGTLLLVNQNELLQNQNQLIKNQMSLEEASRRGALVMLMSNIFDKVDDEIKEQKAEMSKHGKIVTDSTKFSISQSLIGQIAALSHALKPYRFMDGEILINEPLSPERGQLLLTITRLPLDTTSLKHIYAKATFEGADLREAILFEANLIGVNLMGANLFWTQMTGANLSGANLSGAELKGAILRRAILRDAILVSANLEGVSFTWADLEGAILTSDQLCCVNSLFESKLPSNLDIISLKKTYPRLFKNPLFSD